MYLQTKREETDYSDISIDYRVKAFFKFSISHLESPLFPTNVETVVERVL